MDPYQARCAQGDPLEDPRLNLLKVPTNKYRTRGGVPNPREGVLSFNAFYSVHYVELTATGHVFASAAHVADAGSVHLVVRYVARSATETFVPVLPSSVYGIDIDIDIYSGD